VLYGGKFSYVLQGIILLSGIVAFGVNFSAFLITGSLSPLAYPCVISVHRNCNCKFYL